MINDQRTHSEMKLLYAVARVIAEHGELTSIISTILTYLNDITGFSCGTLSFKDKHHQNFNLCKDPEWIEKILPAHERVMKRGMVLSQAGFSSERLVPLPPGVTLLIVPIFYENNVVGTLSGLKRNISNRDELEQNASFLSAVAELISGTLIVRIKDESSLTELQEQNAELRRTLFQLEEHGRTSEIIGNSLVMRQVYRQIAQVAPAGTTALIYGETGTGKELVAKAIHSKSNCSDGPFIALNCGALPDSLLESELFGHEKGAFTGALQSKEGRFEEAHGGTLFLDEIGELSLDAQTRLLRVIQEKEVQRIGGGKTRKIEVRLICATNRNLDDALKQGTFREDLYYRINVFSFTLPPLRERSEDILILTDHFLSKANHGRNDHSFQLSEETKKVITEYNWPGNVRELGNIIERATLVATDSFIHPEHLPPHFLPTVAQIRSDRSLEGRVALLEQEIIEEALNISEGNQRKAAEYLQTTKRVIQYKLEKYGIDYRQFRQK